MFVAASLASLLTGCAVKDSMPVGSMNIESANYSVKFIPTKRSPADPWTSHFQVMKKDESRQILEVASGVRGGDPQQDLGFNKDDVHLVERFSPFASPTDKSRKSPSKTFRELPSPVMAEIRKRIS